MKFIEKNYSFEISQNRSLIILVQGGEPGQDSVCMDKPPPQSALLQLRPVMESIHARITDRVAGPHKGVQFVLATQFVHTQSGIIFLQDLIEENKVYYVTSCDCRSTHSCL